jgi:hypothetical protein
MAAAGVAPQTLSRTPSSKRCRTTLSGESQPCCSGRILVDVGDDRRRQQLAEARLLWTMPLLRARFIARRSGFGTDPHVLSLHPSGVRDA